jgi:hypothetical protein
MDGEVYTTQRLKGSDPLSVSLRDIAEADEWRGRFVF